MEFDVLRVDCISLMIRGKNLIGVFNGYGTPMAIHKLHEFLLKLAFGPPPPWKKLDSPEKW